MAALAISQFRLNLLTFRVYCRSLERTVVTMLIDTLRELHTYTEWANDRILTAAEGLSPEQFLQSDLPNVWPIRDTLVHIMWAQVTWLGRWKQDVSGLECEINDFDDVASLRAHWEKVNAVHRAFLERLDEPQPDGEGFTYTNHLQETHSFPLPMLILHLNNHSTYHRGEVAALLSRFGCSPGELDITRWLARGRPAPTRSAEAAG